MERIIFPWRFNFFAEIISQDENTLLGNEKAIFSAAFMRDFEDVIKLIF